MRVARPTAGPAAKQVRRDCEKAGRPAAIAAELVPGSATAIAGSAMAVGPVRVAVPTAEEHRKGSPELGPAGFVAEPAEQYFARGSSGLAVVAVGEEAAVPIAAGQVAAVVAVVPTAAGQVAAVAAAVVPTAVVLQEEHFEVLGSVPIAAEQVGARGTEQAEAASTAAASLA